MSCPSRLGAILRRKDGNLYDALREDLARAVLVAFLVGTVAFLGHRGLEVSMDRKLAWLCDWVVSECTTHECGIFCAMRGCLRYFVLCGLFWNRQLLMGNDTAVLKLGRFFTPAVIQISLDTGSFILSFRSTHVQISHRNLRFTLHTGPLMIHR